MRVRGVRVSVLLALRDGPSAYRLLREVDRARFTQGPRELVARMRALGAAAPDRSPLERRVLRRLVRIFDRTMGGPNCYRRALVLLALDKEIAAQPFSFGLDVQRGEARGHAWVGARDSDAFDVEFSL